jgi:hypothetical protein
VGHDFSTTYPWKPHIPAAVGRCVVRRGPWKKHRRAACEAATVISEDKIVQRRAPKQRHRVVRPVTVTVKTVSLSQRCETCAAAVRTVCELRAVPLTRRRRWQLPIHSADGPRAACKQAKTKILCAPVDFRKACHQTVTWRPLMRSSRVMPWSANTGFVENCRSRMTDFPKSIWPPIRLVATRTSWDRASRLAMPKDDPGPCRLGCNDALPEADPAHFWWSVQISSCTHRAEVLSVLFGDRNLAPAIGIQFEPPSHSGPEASEFR